MAVIGKTTGLHVASEIGGREVAAWLAEVQDGLVSEWRIYSDVEYTERS